MKTYTFRRTLIASALALAFPIAAVHAEDVKELTSPDVSDVSFKIQGASKVNPYYRMYSGVEKSGVDASIGIDYVKRMDDGTWLTIQGADLGTKNQEIGLGYAKQGDWSVNLGYSELTKFAPYTINTKVAGVNTDKLVLNQDFRSSAGLGPESNLSLERTATTLSGSKLFMDAFKFSFSLKSEDKSGSIMSSSVGSTWNNATGSGRNYSTLYFAPQPANYSHTQVETTLDYFTKTFQLSGGYYGSFFTNNYSAINITPGIASLPSVGTGTAIAAGAYGIPWIALPPDNEAQQFWLSGGYNFSSATRVTFKASQERLRQDDSLIPNFGAITGATWNQLNPPGVPYNPALAGITSADAAVNVTTYAATLTSKLSKELDLLASWRYEDREDKTPQREYITGSPIPHESHTANRGSFELGYRLGNGYKLVGGFDYDRKETPDQVRDEVTDQVVRIELRKAMSDLLNGRIAFSHSDRDGGAWNLPRDASFPTATQVTAPLHFVDRKRDKAKLMLDWTPTDPLSLQLYYEYAKDTYSFTPATGYEQRGMTDGKADMWGLDAAYRIDDVWKATAYFTSSSNKTHQSEIYTPRVLPQTCAITPATAANTCVPWLADLDMSGDVIGAGLQGKLWMWDIGANYLYSKDSTKYTITFDPAFPTAATSSVPSGAGVLPDTVYEINSLRLYGTYKQSKNTRFRVDYVYDMRKMDDYTWANWTFSDGTRVNVSPKQKTQLIGLTIIQSF